MKLRRRTLEQIHSPIGAAHALLDRHELTQPLLDLSQAAPGYPTAESIVAAVQAAAAAPDGGRYVPQAGLPQLREAFVRELSSAYDADIGVDQVMITSGCNQAFTLVSSALCEWGDRVVLPSPFYFNHDMWLRLDGIGVDHVDTAPSFVPDPAAIDAAIAPTTRAIVLVTPGNPTGAIAPPEVIHDVADIARRREVVLILDETYRCFRPTDQPAHELFRNEGWDDYVVGLYSFSKEFAIPGYRVGAAVGHPDLLAEALKLLDCVEICAPRIGQVAAWAGLTTAIDWRDEQVARIAQRQARFESVMASRPGGFELVSSGAYFGWVDHHRDSPTADVVEELVRDQAILAIPGDAFTPSDQRYLRMSFANLTDEQIDELAVRLSSMA